MEANIELVMKTFDEYGFKFEQNEKVFKQLVSNLIYFNLIFRQLILRWLLTSFQLSKMKWQKQTNYLSKTYQK